jgi:hypothetical protein
METQEFLKRIGILGIASKKWIIGSAEVRAYLKVNGVILTWVSHIKVIKSRKHGAVAEFFQWMGYDSYYKAARMEIKDIKTIERYEGKICAYTPDWADYEETPSHREHRDGSINLR